MVNLTATNPGRIQAKQSLPIAVSLLALLVVSMLLFSRDYTNFSFEPDLIGTFIPEAERLQQGQALKVQYHLPFYPALLAVMEPFVGNWFTAGLLITWLSTILVLAASYRLARDLLDWRSGLGVIAVIAVSPLFLTLSGVASSDLLFLALYQSTCLVAFQAYRDGRSRHWAATGVLVAFCYLTRTNGIILLLLLFVPFLSQDHLATRLRASLTILSGIFFGLAPWATYAWITGSPLVPTDSHLTLATAFYDNIFFIHGGEHNNFVYLDDQRFANVWEVLGYDPMRIPIAYSENVKNLIFRSLPELVSIPILVMIIPGLLLNVLGEGSRFLKFLAILTLAHVLLTCLADFTSRYFLFLVPFLGLGLHKTLSIVIENLDSRIGRHLFHGIMVFCFLAAFAKSTKYAWQNAREGERELAAALPVVRSIAAEEDLILVARHPNLAYHSQVPTKVIPFVHTPDELREELLSYAGTRSLYLFFGWKEAIYRPAFAHFRTGESHVDWLLPIANGPEDGGWAVYKIEHQPY